MDTPGVTRDRIYGRVNHNDKSFYLIDTGGISLGEDDFAKDILVQATLAIDEADLVLFVVDGNDDPDASDKKVAEILEIPIIGIGAGGGVDGQVLVMHDMLGINKGFSPRFLRRYADVGTIITDAVAKYIEDVKTSDFPNEKEQY